MIATTTNYLGKISKKTRKDALTYDKHKNAFNSHKPPKTSVKTPFFTQELEQIGENCKKLLLADGALTVGWGKTFWRVGRFLFFYENSRFSETKSRNIDPKVRR